MVAEPFRTLRWSTWLGWQIESNWADWKLFILYLVVKPITGSMVLVCMYFAAKAAAPTRVPAAFLSYVYVSNACFGLVGCVMLGMSQVVATDRDHYQMLKYIFRSPGRFRVYFVGRGLARAVEGVVGGGITILAGTLFFPDVRTAVAAVDPGWLFLFLVVGSVMLWACGMFLASAVLNMHRNGMFLSEGVAGVVYLLSGVIFPLAILPVPLQWIGRALPTTYWLEGMRRAITGPAPEGSALAQSPLARMANGEILVLLVGTTVGLVVVAEWFYRWSVRRAWRNGKIEETSGM
ncbi:MAG TPA: ABC transporter permease [Fimbriiglobus sp.]|jgi:ABC-2 type transport system permease protein